MLKEFNAKKKKKKLKILNLCGIYNINMANKSRKAYERNGVETVTDNGIL